MNNYPTPEAQFPNYANSMATDDMANLMNFVISSQNQPNMMPDYSASDKVLNWMGTDFSFTNQPPMMHQPHLTAAHSVLSQSSINSAYSNIGAFSTVTQNPNLYNLSQTSTQNLEAQIWEDYVGFLNELDSNINGVDSMCAIETINLLDKYVSKGLVPQTYPLIEVLWSKIKNVDVRFLTNSKGFANTSVEAYCMLVYLTIHLTYSTTGRYFNKISWFIKKTQIEIRQMVACCLIQAIARLDEKNLQCLLFLDGLIKLYFILDLGDIWKQIKAQDAYPMLKSVFVKECTKLAYYGNNFEHILSQFRFSFISRLMKMFCFVFMGPIEINVNYDFMTHVFPNVSILFNTCYNCYTNAQMQKAQVLKQFQISADDCKRQLNHLKAIIQLIVRLTGLIIDKDPNDISALTSLFIVNKGHDMLLNTIAMEIKTDDDVKTRSFAYKTYAILSKRHDQTQKLPLLFEANDSLNIVWKILNDNETQNVHKETQNAHKDRVFLLHDVAEFWLNAVSCNDQFRKWLVTPYGQQHTTPLEYIIDITLRIGVTLSEKSKSPMHSMFYKIFDLLLLFIQSSNLDHNPYRDLATLIINNSNLHAIPLFFLILMRPRYFFLQPLNPRAFATLKLIERCVDPPKSVPAVNSESEKNLGAILLQFFCCFISHEPTEKDDTLLETLKLSLEILKKLMADCNHEQNIISLMHKLANTNLFDTIRYLRSEKRLILLLEFIKFATTNCPSLIEPWKVKTKQHSDVWKQTCKSCNSEIRRLAEEITCSFGPEFKEEIYGETNLWGVDI
ncbi:hypothetical protein M3Y96_01182900 [Aphelenchoides besseyi]|nr:hypothetical protein M3Y96_01182900 [Aphelenchoides besseyi]